MFSRTTMASSISRPTHSDSAISVTMLIEKPKAYMNRKVPISAIGSVRPVMTVERQRVQEQEDDERWSAARLRAACAARCSPTRGSAASRRAPRPAPRPAGSCGCSCASTAFRPSTTVDGVLALRLLTSSASVRWPLNSARCLELLRPVHHLGDLPRRTGCAVPRARHDDCAKSSGPLDARPRSAPPARCSRDAQRCRPAGPGSRCARRPAPARRRRRSASIAAGSR